jgi:hypothetical protein
MALDKSKAIDIQPNLLLHFKYNAFFINGYKKLRIFNQIVYNSKLWHLSNEIYENTKQPFIFVEKVIWLKYSLLMMTMTFENC